MCNIVYDIMQQFSFSELQGTQPSFLYSILSALFLFILLISNCDGKLYVLNATVAAA